jgi:hypothetical protein
MHLQLWQAPTSWEWQFLIVFVQTKEKSFLGKFQHLLPIVSQQAACQYNLTMEIDLYQKEERVSPLQSVMAFSSAST